MSVILFLFASLLSQPVLADTGPTLIRYDSYSDDGEFVFGANFDGFEGLGKYNCMAQVYSFDDSDFPLVPIELRMFWAGEGTGAADDVLVEIYFYHFDGYAADRWVLAEGQYRLLDQEEVLIRDVELEGTWVNLNLADNEFDFDGDLDQEGKQPITYGSIVANVCYENEQTMPAIAFDVDGYDAEPIPDNEEDIVDGHETTQFRSLIYWNGLWSDLYDYLLNNFGYDESGDLIMRLVVDRVGDDTEASDRELTVHSVEPNSQDAGESTLILVTGEGMDTDAQAFVGDRAIAGVVVTNTSIEQDDGSTQVGQLLNGYTSADLEVGQHDIVVQNPDGTSSILPNAYRVVSSDDLNDGNDWPGVGTGGSGSSNDEWGGDDDDDDDGKGFCGCSTVHPNQLSWTFMMLMVVMCRRGDPRPSERA